jgi:hypothetical protein
MCFDFRELQWNTSNLTDEELFKQCEQKYEEAFLTGPLSSKLGVHSADTKFDYGIHTLHDGELVIFRRDRGIHAFRWRKPRTEVETTSNSNTKRTAKPDYGRIRHINVIKELITLNINGSSCFLVKERNARNFLMVNRVYLAGPMFVVILTRNETRKPGEPPAQWAFNTCYKIDNRDHFNKRFLKHSDKLKEPINGTSTKLKQSDCI